MSSYTKIYHNVNTVLKEQENIRRQLDGLGEIIIMEDFAILADLLETIPDLTARERRAVNALGQLSLWFGAGVA